MLRLIRFLKGYRFASVVAPLFKVMEAIFELIIPLVVAKIIDVGIPNGDTRYIWKMGVIMISLGAAGLLFSMTCQYLAARASTGFGTNVRSALYRHINTFGYPEMDKFGAPSLVTRLTSDVNQTQVAVAMFIRLVLRAPFIAIGAIIMAITISPVLSLIFVVMSVVVSVVLYFIMSRSAPFYIKIQSKLDRVALLTRENLSGARVVRAFSRQDEEQEDFEEASESLSKSSRAVGAIAALLNPLTYVLVNAAIIAVIWFGGIKVDAGVLSQGQILALVNYLSQILLALVVLANLVVTFTKASACAKRINEVLDTVPAVRDESRGRVEPIDNAPKFEFGNVDFSYGENLGHSLENVNVKVLSGETLGVIGSTGSGKTTLINLLSRFYDVSSGEVLIDGVNVKEYPFSQLREKIGLVPQRTSLFSGSLRENMQMGRADISDEKIISAMKTAQAYEFVSALDGGLDAPVLRDGRNFSGGQRQRLTIARALSGSPEILVLDDSSSALDYATDFKLRKALKTETAGLTVVIVSQRYSSIKNADKILVLDDGKVAGIGTHSELLSTCDVYKEICSSQDEDRKGGEKQ